MPTVHVNGIDVFFEDTGGEGTPVVLIHGHSVDLRMWPAQVLALREAGYSVIRYDVRGHGRSSVPNEGYTWPVYARDLLAFLDALDIGAAHLVGFSMGGGIALEFALDHPDRVLSLTLIDATVPGFAYSDEFVSRIEELVEAVRREGWRNAAERLWLTHPMFNGLRRHPAAFEIVRDIVLRFPALDYLIDQPEPEGPEAIDRLAALRVPVLVVVGAEDLEDFRLAAQVAAANAPRAKLAVIPGSGHLTPLERPAELNALLLDFLADPEAAVTPRLQIRPAAPTDADAIAALDATFSTRRVLHLERRGLAPELTFDFTVVEREGDHRRAITHPPRYWRGQPETGGAVLVATLAETVVGAITLRVSRPGGSIEVSDLRVATSVRRHGIGRALMDAAVAHTRASGLATVRLILPSDDLPALAFLLACGFRISGFDDEARVQPSGEPAAEAPIALFLTYVLPAG